jgi:hypothetical protein
LELPTRPDVAACCEAAVVASPIHLFIVWGRRIEQLPKPA